MTLRSVAYYFSIVAAVAMLGTVAVGIAIVNGYIVSQHQLSLDLAASIADTTRGLNAAIARDAAISALLAADDAAQTAALAAVNATQTAALTALSDVLQSDFSTLNATIYQEIGYLSSLLNVSSTSASAFLDSITASLQAQLNNRIESVNGVSGDDTTFNVDLVSLSTATLTITPNTTDHTVGLTIHDVITAVQSADDGIAVSTDGNGVSTVTLNAAAINATVDSIVASAVTTVTTLNDTVTTVQSQVDALNATLQVVLAALTDAQAAIVILQTQVSNITTTATPTGAIMPWSGNVSEAAPGGYLLCDGTTYLMVDYALLYAVVGTLYGGDGITTFAVPDLQGTVPVGYKSSGAFNVAMGSVVGAETHTLSTTEIPGHTHTGTVDSDGSHSHTGSTGSPSVSMSHSHDSGIMTNNGGSLPASGTVFYSIGSVDQPGVATLDAYRSGLTDLSHTHGINPDGAHTHTFSTASTGSGGAHAIIQPSTVLQYIIKT